MDPNLHPNPAMQNARPSGDADGLREALSRSERGAPTTGQAVSDIFSTDEIFQRIVVAADEEFSRSNRLLFFSGLAAGLSIALTFIGRVALTAMSGDPTGLVGNLLYPIGFVFIVLGRYQLFTENTLTPVTLVLTRIVSLRRLMRIWGIVFVANLLGASLAAFFLAGTDVFSAEAHAVALGFGAHAEAASWTSLFSKSVIAGWLVAGMVWLTHAARDAVARLLLVYLLMFMIPTADLFHCITGSIEVLYALFYGQTTFAAYLAGFLVPVTLGNTVGGVLLVALLNYAQTKERRFPDRMRLSWRQWVVGRSTAPEGGSEPKVKQRGLTDQPNVTTT